jgi:hypothetical protein
LGLVSSKGALPALLLDVAHALLAWKYEHEAYR